MILQLCTWNLACTPFTPSTINPPKDSFQLPPKPYPKPIWNFQTCHFRSFIHNSKSQSTQVMLFDTHLHAHHLTYFSTVFITKFNTEANSLFPQSSPKPLFNLPKLISFKRPFFSSFQSYQATPFTHNRSTVIHTFLSFIYHFQQPISPELFHQYDLSFHNFIECSLLFPTTPRTSKLDNKLRRYEPTKLDKQSMDLVYFIQIWFYL